MIILFRTFFNNGTKAHPPAIIEYSSKSAGVIPVHGQISGNRHTMIGGERDPGRLKRSHDFHILLPDLPVFDNDQRQPELPDLLLDMAVLFQTGVFVVQCLQSAIGFSDLLPGKFDLARSIADIANQRHIIKKDADGDADQTSDAANGVEKTEKASFGSNSFDSGIPPSLTFGHCTPVNFHNQNSCSI